MPLILQPGGFLVLPIVFLLLTFAACLSHYVYVCYVLFSIVSERIIIAGISVRLSKISANETACRGYNKKEHKILLFHYVTFASLESSYDSWIPEDSVSPHTVFFIYPYFYVAFQICIFSAFNKICGYFLCGYMIDLKRPLIEFCWNPSTGQHNIQMRSFCVH